MFLGKFSYRVLENGRKCRCLKGVIQRSRQRLTFWPCDQILKIGRAARDGYLFGLKSINYYIRCLDHSRLDKFAPRTIRDILVNSRILFRTICDFALDDSRLCSGLFATFTLVNSRLFLNKNICFDLKTINRQLICHLQCIFLFTLY